jgi:NTE family protein
VSADRQIAKGDSHEHNTFFNSAPQLDDGLRPAEVRPGSAAGRRHEAGAPAGKRALVLGGGGSTGNAWLIGVIAGLFDAGLDVTTADLTIGT